MESLPQEVIDHIVSYLSPQDCKNLAPLHSSFWYNKKLIEKTSFFVNKPTLYDYGYTRRNLKCGNFNPHTELTRKYNIFTFYVPYKNPNIYAEVLRRCKQYCFTDECVYYMSFECIETKFVKVTFKTIEASKHTGNILSLSFGDNSYPYTFGIMNLVYYFFNNTIQTLVVDRIPHYKYNVILSPIFENCNTLKIVSKRFEFDSNHLCSWEHNNLTKIKHLIFENNEFNYSDYFCDYIGVNLTKFTSLETVKFSGNFNKVKQTSVLFKAFKTLKMSGEKLFHEIKSNDYDIIVRQFIGKGLIYIKN